MRKKVSLEGQIEVKIKFKRCLKPTYLKVPRDSKLAYEGALFVVRHLGTVVFWANFDEIEWVSTGEIEVK